VGVIQVTVQNQRNNEFSLLGHSSLRLGCSAEGRGLSMEPFKESETLEIILRARDVENGCLSEPTDFF